MPAIHKLLDEAQKQCTSLAEEIAAYKSATRVNNELAKSLTETSRLLEIAVTSIKPLTEPRLRRSVLLLSVGVGATGVLALANLVITLIGR